MKISKSHKERGIKPKMNKEIATRISASKKGILFSDNHKENLSLNHADFKGTKNPCAKIIEIYSITNELMFTCMANFSSICKDNKLPSALFRKSYMSNKRIEKYDNMSKTP